MKDSTVYYIIIQMLAATNLESSMEVNGVTKHDIVFEN